MCTVLRTAQPQPPPRPANKVCHSLVSQFVCAAVHNTIMAWPLVPAAWPGRLPVRRSAASASLSESARRLPLPCLREY